MEHMLKSFGTPPPKPPFSSRLPHPPETTKPAERRALRCSNMAEAMGFELMDLLQSTVFKTLDLSLFNNKLTGDIFRISSVLLALEATSIKGLISKCGNDLPPLLWRPAERKKPNLPVSLGIISGIFRGVFVVSLNPA